MRRQGFARRSSSAGNSKFDLCFVAGRRRKRRSGIGTMNKFNLPLRNIQKERRANRSEKRRLRSAAPSLKISVKPGPRSLSGKKKRKLEKKWRKVCILRSRLPPLFPLGLVFLFLFRVRSEGLGCRSSLSSRKRVFGNLWTRFRVSRTVETLWLVVLGRAPFPACSSTRRKSNCHHFLDVFGFI